MKKNSEQDVLNVYSSRKKSQTRIPKEFETFHFTCATVDVLNKTEELNSKLHCRVYYCLFKRKLKIIKYNPNTELLCKHRKYYVNTYFI